jgi:hypothetical protein
MKQDVTFLLERLADHEARSGVRFEGLYAELEQFDQDAPTVSIRGEAHALHGSELRADVEVRANAYDQAGRVIGSGMYFIVGETFFGFETVEIYLMELESRPSKIRLYPKLS